MQAKVCDVHRVMAPPNNSTDYNAKSKESVEHELMDWEPPRAQGLYDPQNEHEACGVGFIVAIDGKRNHKVREEKLNRYITCNDTFQDRV